MEEQTANKQKEIEELERYVQYLSLKQLGELTKKEYLHFYSKFKPDSLELNYLEQYIFDFLSQNNNPVCRAFLLNWLAMNKIKIELPKITRHPKRKIKPVPTEQEMKAWMSYLYNKNKTHGVALMLQHYGALRRNELLHLDIFDFQLNEWLEETKVNPNTPCKLLIKYGKGEKQRYVLIPLWVMKKVLALFEEIIALDLGHRTKLFTFGKDRWHEILSISSKQALGRHISSHQIRKSRATILFKQGVSLLDLKNYLGHSSISTTERYLQITEEESLTKLQKRMEDEKE